MADRKKNSRREPGEDEIFHLSDTFFFDDDVPYSRFDGAEAEEILIPSEAPTEEESTAVVLKEELPSPKAEAIPEKAAKREKQDIYSLLSLTEEFIEYVGSETIALFLYLYKKLSPAVVLPFMLIFSLLKKLFKKIKSAPKLIHLSIADDIKKISLELKAIISAAKAVKNKKLLVFSRAMGKYFLISFQRHKHFWKTLFNILLPTAAVFVLLVIWNGAFRSGAFALEVIYNGQSLGFVKDTETFEEGRNQAINLLFGGRTDSEEASSLVLQPVYKVKRVDANELSNPEMISEGIIASSDETYIRACGIYIDGEFLCAVRNESDAVSVFSQILEPYEKNAAEGTIVGFVEEIEYIQGYYHENSTSIWDTTTLQKTLSKPKSKAQRHKMQQGDTISSVAKKYSLTRKQLKALNPNTDFSKPEEIKSLLVAQKENYVRVKVMKTRTRTEGVPYETIERESSTLAKGTKKTTQNGAYGKVLVTELVTYIDGKESYTSLVSRKQTKAPVNKIVLVGTKTYSSPVYSGPVTSRGFIWPTRGAYSISSRFGYRSASISGWSFHGGLDIIRYGGSTGIPVVAAASGTVTTAYSGWSGYGHTVTINHGGGIVTRYAHMQPGSIAVRAGQYVYQGQQIGRIGSTGNSTGPHLHFEVLVNGVKVNPLNYIR